MEVTATLADEPKSLSVERVMDHVLSGIRDGKYVPGQRLVAREIAEELNVSRGPVREALHILGGEGVVELTPHRGARIRKLSTKELIDVLHVLGTMGGLALKLSLPKLGTKKQQARVRRSVNSIRSAASAQQSGELFDALLDFHQIIYDVADNAFLNKLFGHIYMDFLNHALALAFSGPHWERFQRNYDVIGEAILEGDANKANKKYQQHMNWAISLLEKPNSK
jgi:DNA-binding GntR family transcriptional regulator